MRRAHFANRSEWRQWLSDNHASVRDGLWLVFNKRRNGGLRYEEAVEEALCFGWIDSLVKSIDHETYCRKFTPRRDGSQWSELNKKRVARLVKNKRMAAPGLAKIAAAKRLGTWRADPRPVFRSEVPADLSEALRNHHQADAFFWTLAPSHQRRFIGWIATAKKPETRAKRLQECLSLLHKGEKLGLK